MGEHRGIACAWPAQGRAPVTQGDLLLAKKGVLVGGWGTDLGLNVKLCRSFTGTPVPGITVKPGHGGRAERRRHLERTRLGAGIPADRGSAPGCRPTGTLYFVLEDAGD